MDEVRPILLVICGPTASGKTGFAIEVARHFGTEIISADSRQIYKEMNIGVARPTPDELATVPHHFIASHSIHQPLSAGQFELAAIPVIERLHQQHPVVVMAGGSGLFIKAVTVGLDDLPGDVQVRNELQAILDKEGLAWLQDEVSRKDPEFFAGADSQNPRRLLRALEVITITGLPFSALRTGTSKQRPFNTCFFAPDIPRDALYARINMRVDAMISDGLEQEAHALLPYRQLSALQTVGYSELFDYFDGKTDKATAIEKIKQHSRHYAKRQLTWFRKEQELEWITPENFTAAVVQKTEAVL
jgi:tRNA dimethylallyltransferase